MSTSKNVNIETSPTSWFWNEYFWLPENVTWADLESTNGMHYPQVRELGYSLLAACIITAVRIFTEAFVFVPIGYFSGWMDRKKGTVSQRIWSHLFFGFAGRTKFKRVAETAWRFTFYLGIWLAGLIVLYKEPQFQSVIECFHGWPRHHVPDDVWLYYIIESGFYLALLFSIFTYDVKRSDHSEMATHHMATILLLSISFSINFVRVGTLILLLHDSADIFLELGKLFRYAGWDRALTIDFCVLIFVWTFTRLFYFPFKLVKCMLFDAPPLIQKNFQWTNLLQRPVIPRVLMLALCLLLVLHLFWTYLLLKIAIKSLNSGVDDIREESEPEDEEVEEDRDDNGKKKKA